MKLHQSNTAIMPAVICLLGLTLCAPPIFQAQAATQLKPAEETGWTLATSDDFNRAEPGDAWEITEGAWKVADGKLQGSGVIVSSRSFPARDKTGLIYTGGFALGFIRVEFGFTPLPRDAAQPLAQIPEWEAVGDACFINALWEGDAEDARMEPGYTFQLRGRDDDALKIIKRGGQLIASTEQSDPALEPGRRYHVVIENDEGHLRFFVDGKAVFEHKEMFSIMGSGYDKVGFCFRHPAQVDNLKVYYKRLPGGLDRDEML